MAYRHRGKLPYVLLGACCALLIVHALRFNFVCDDAFISFRYADNLARHGELAFNLGERVDGYTNFLWTLLMAVVIGLGADPALWSKILGIALGVGGLLLVARYTARTEGASGWDALAPVWLALAPAYACWCTGGMETQLFTFTVTGGWTAYLLERRTGGRLWSGIWFALSALTRPEGALLFALVAGHRGGALLWNRLRLQRRDILWASSFAAIFVPYFIWRWAYYGWPLPNTFYVKVGAAGWGPGWRYFASWVLEHHLWLLPLLAVAAARGRQALLSLGGLLIVGLSLVVIRVGGDFMGLHRFLVPLMPLVAVIGALGIRRLVDASRGRARVAACACVIVAFALVAWRADRLDRWSMRPESERGVDRIGWLKMFAGQCTAIGKWLEVNAPPGSSLATTAAGIIPFYSRLYALDLLGLNDRYIAHEVKPQGNRPGHAKRAPPEYVLGKKIDYLIYQPAVSKGMPGPVAWLPNLRRHGYEWRTVQVPGLSPAWWGFWQRSRPGAG